MMKAESTSETSVNFDQTVRGNNPEDSHLNELKASESNLEVILNGIHACFDPYVIWICKGYVRQSKLTSCSHSSVWCTKHYYMTLHKQRQKNSAKDL
jgi:hypothetical protein